MERREQGASPGNEAPQGTVKNFASSADAVSTPNYIIAAPPSIPQSRCPRLVVWLRCTTCTRGYFVAVAPAPGPCPTCVGGRLAPIALWDLRTEAAPAGMLQRGEV